MSGDSLSSDDQITLWLNRLQADDSVAAQNLWNRYSIQLAAVARKRFGAISRRAYDEEDAAISAFRSFCRGVSEKRFPELDSRDNLWRLLVTITARKVNARRRYEERDRRGGASVKEIPLYQLEDGAGNHLADIIEGKEPSPEFATEVSEQCRRLLGKLDDELMRQIALLRFEGFNNSEIAEKLGCTRNRVARRMARIQAIWEGELAVSDD